MFKLNKVFLSICFLQGMSLHTACVIFLKFYNDNLKYVSLSCISVSQSVSNMHDSRSDPKTFEKYRTKF